MGRAKNEGAVLATRLWSRVCKTPTCWLWTGALFDDGYGGIRANGSSSVRVHRLVYEMAHGPIPAGTSVLHRCDVRNCVRPDHLFLGTHQDNMADMRAKGRQAQGERAPKAKLTREQVAEIRLRASGAPINYAALGREFHVCGSTVRAAVLGRSWLDA